MGFWDIYDGPNFCVRNTQDQARKAVFQYALEWKLVKYDFSSHDLDYDVTQYKRFADSLDIEWVPADVNPMMRPPGGFYNNGEAYSKDSDPMWGNFDGLPCYVLKDVEGKVVGYFGFEVSDRCLHCPLCEFRSPVSSLRRAPYCGADGRPCGRKILDGCEEGSPVQRSNDSTKGQ